VDGGIADDEGAGEVDGTDVDLWIRAGGYFDLFVEG
jgi:hypothetical protein